MKAAALLLAGGMALSACASDETSGGTASSGSASGSAGGDALKIGLAYDTGGRGDKSFNDSAYAGVDAAIKKLGGEVQELSPSGDGSDRAELLTQLAQAGYNPVIAVGFNYDEVIGDVAADFPDTTFAQVDGSNADDAKGDNVTGLVFAEEQGAFLAGVAAASKTATNNVGFVGGVQSPLIEKFEAGFTAGAKAVKPDITVQSQYLSPAGDFSGFGDPQKGNIVAQGMYQGGADIVFHAAGGSGVGVFEAAVAAGARAIGVDSDQYLTAPAEQQAVIMTSMLKRVDNAVEGFITDFSEGPVEGGTDITNDLSTDGVGLSDSGGYITDIQSTIDDYKQKIVDGEITVPTAP